MKSDKFKHLLVAAGIMIQLVFYGFALQQRSLHPILYKAADFSAFYTAGRIAATGRYDLVYDITTQEQTRQAFMPATPGSIEHLPFNHPPLIVPLLRLLVDGNYLASYARWAALMVVFLAAAMIILKRLLRSEQIQPPGQTLLILASAIFCPIFVSLFRGQDTTVVLLGVFLWLYGLITGRDVLAGGGLALAILRPQIALMLAIPFIFRRRKVWWSFCVVAGLFALFSILLVGWTGVRDYLLLIGISAQGLGFGAGEHGMLNFTGLVLRLFPHGDLTVIHAVGWGLFCVALAGLSTWWRRSSIIHFRHIALAGILSLFFAPHLHYHDLALLLVPSLALGLAAIRSKKLSAVDLAGLITLASLSLSISFVWKPLLNTLPYLWMAALLWFTLRWQAVPAQPSGPLIDSPASSQPTPRS